MNKLFINILYALTLMLTQTLVSETIKTRSYSFEMPEEVKRTATEAIPQVIDTDTIMVDNTNHDYLIIALFEEKLEIYHMSLDAFQYQEFKKASDAIQEMKKVVHDNSQDIGLLRYTDSEDPVFHTSEVKLKDAYLKNAQNFLIDAAESIEIDECIVECPSIILKANRMELAPMMGDAHIIELKSNKTESLLSAIKLTFKNKIDFDLLLGVIGDVDFDYNFMVLCCIGVSKVELKCLPGSFYTDGGKICFNSEMCH